MKIQINTQAKYFFGAILVIAFLHYTLMSVAVLGKPTSIFYMDEEITLASWFTSILSFITGFFFIKFSNFLLRTEDKKEKLVTLFVGIFFLLLSFDEYFSVHEYLNKLVKENSGGNSIFHEIAEFSWMGPLSILVLIIVWALVQLIRLEQNKAIRNSYITGLVCFILVLILELTGGRLYGHWTYAWVIGMEETLEMIGITLFLNGVLNKLQLNNNT